MMRSMNTYTKLMFLGPVGALAMSVASTAEAATPKYYNSDAGFQADVVKSVTDPYSDPKYVFIQNNAVMSAVLGETDYVTTGFQNLNIVSGGTYCAGCNGSFELTFTSTTVGTNVGVTGVGMNVVFSDQGTPYFAFITFADNTTANIQMPAGGSYWGVSAPERITKIHFGLSMGGTTTGGSFGIDNLKIADMMAGCKVNADCPADMNPCTDSVCTAGKCGFANNVAPCDDGSMCTSMDVCAAGVCGGAAVVCDDKNGCTDDSCDPKQGCLAAPNVAPCDDGDMCTSMDVCAAGACGGAVVECDDDNVCTMDSCDPALGCVNDANAACCLVDADCGADETCDVDTNLCVPAAGTSSGTTDVGTSTGVDSSTGGSSTGGSSTGGSSTGVDPTTGADSSGTGIGESASGTSGGGGTTGADTGTGTGTGTDAGTGGTGGTGDGVSGPSDDGCNCASDPKPQNGAWLMLAALGLFIRRRRAA